jgi:hypothetical protein
MHVVPETLKHTFCQLLSIILHSLSLLFVKKNLHTSTFGMLRKCCRSVVFPLPMFPSTHTCTKMIFFLILQNQILVAKLELCLLNNNTHTLNLDLYSIIPLNFSSSSILQWLCCRVFDYHK